jgi:hypothetical protein
MMGGGAPTYGQDTNIKVTNVAVNASGTQVTASVQILPGAVAGARQVEVTSGHGSMMGALSATTFSVQ